MIIFVARFICIGGNKLLLAERGDKGAIFRAFVKPQFCALARHTRFA